ncbi:MAG: inositol monophosphatase [Gemmataceae bacterium]|nr:inositol monophosphatase [Gemmataceae bacterium]
MREKELATALLAASEAGKHILSAYRDLDPMQNAPADLTTETDKQSQEIILKILRDAFPEDSLCAEENTPTLALGPKGSKRTWVVDPIDGTRGFAMKNGEFSVMVALLENGQVTVGVVLEPASGKTTYAARGQGCKLAQLGASETVCLVGKASALKTSTLVQSHAKPGAVSKAEQAFQPEKILQVYSAGLKLAMVARGEADLYANNYLGFHDWDICAGHILVEEAGGLVTTFDGTPISYGGVGFKQTRGMLASNLLVHTEALEKTQGLLG